MVGIAEQLMLFANGVFGTVAVALVGSAAYILHRLVKGAPALHDPIEPQRID